MGEEGFGEAAAEDGGEETEEAKGEDKGVHGIAGAEPAGEGGVFDEGDAFAEDGEEGDEYEA